MESDVLDIDTSRRRIVDLTDAVWTYPTPYAPVAEIAGHVAFYPDRVDVSVED